MTLSGICSLAGWPTTCRDGEEQDLAPGSCSSEPTLEGRHRTARGPCGRGAEQHRSPPSAAEAVAPVSLVALCECPTRPWPGPCADPPALLHLSGRSKQDVKITTGLIKTV